MWFFILKSINSAQKSERRKCVFKIFSNLFEEKYKGYISVEEVGFFFNRSKKIFFCEIWVIFEFEKIIKLESLFFINVSVKTEKKLFYIFFK